MPKTITSRSGVAKGRHLPGPDTVELLVVAHDRCRRRGIKVFGHHFTCQEPTKLKISDLKPEIAAKICRHGELRVREYDKDGKCLTPERANPPLPEKKAKAKAKATPSPAGPASKKARGIKDPPKTPTNHPKPAAPLSDGGVAPKRRRKPAGGADG